MTSVVRMIYNYDDGDDNENDDDEYQGYNYDTWKGETPYKEGEHNDVGEDGSEVGNLKMVMVVVVKMMMGMVMMIIMG